MQDEDGFAAFYERHRSTLHRAMTATLGDPQLAAEAADEALVRAAERWEQVSAMTGPEGWLYRVAVIGSAGLRYWVVGSPSCSARSKPLPGSRTMSSLQPNASVGAAPLPRSAGHSRRARSPRGRQTPTNSLG